MKKENTTSLSSVEAVHKKAKRRNFLKKAVYTAPKLIALGYLTRPSAGKADPPGGASGGFGGDGTPPGGG